MTLKGEAEVPEGIPTTYQEARGAVWDLLEKLTRAGMTYDMIFSTVMTEVFKWSIEVNGSSTMALETMATALAQMVKLGPSYECQLHQGGVVQ